VLIEFVHLNYFIVLNNHKKNIKIKRLYRLLKTSGVFIEKNVYDYVLKIISKTNKKL
jgi:hypothetical protein